jgi:hypothetical protein
MAMLIHIGYAKAASSWCQQRIFKNEDSGFYFPYRGNVPEMTYKIIEEHPLDFNIEQVRSAFHSKIDKSHEDPAVFSSERLAGHWFSGGYDRKLIADRINSIFPNAKILIIIREQESILSSVYRQYIYKGGLRSPEKFFKPENINGKNKRPGRARGPEFSFDLFKYDRIIEYYNELFSDDNVLVLPLELLKSNKDEFVERIIEFGEANPEKSFDPFGNRENVGVSAFTAKVQRYVNLLINSDYINDYSIYHTMPTEIMGRFLLRSVEFSTPASLQAQVERDLNEKISSVAGGKFKSSNRNTDSLVDYDLERFGYDM